MRPDYKKGFGWNLVFNVFTKIATPLIGIVVANRLGPGVMGLYLLVTSVMIFADIFRDSAFARVYLREAAIDEPLDRAYAAYSIVGHSIVAAIVGGIGYPMARHFGQPVLLGGMWLAALAVFLNGFSALPYTRLVRAARFKEAGFAESMGSVLSSLWALAWVTQGWGFWALTTMVPIRSAIFLVLTYRVSPYKVGRGKTGLGRRVFEASSILSAINLMWVGFSYGDQFLVTQLFGVVSGGAFGTGKMMVQAADVLAKPITQTATVAFAERKHDPAEVGRTLYKALTLFLVAVAPVYVAVAFLARPIILGILSARFASAVDILPPLCLYFAAVYPGSFAGDSLVMAGKERIPFWGWVGTYIILAAVLVATWGQLSLPGIAWVLALALVGVNTSTLTFAARRYPPTAQALRGLVWGALALLPTALVSYGILLLPIGNAGKLLIAIFAVPLVHLAAIGAIFYHNPVSMFRMSGVRGLWARL